MSENPYDASATVATYTDMRVFWAASANKGFKKLTILVWGRGQMNGTTFYTCHYRGHMRGHMLVGNVSHECSRTQTRTKTFPNLYVWDPRTLFCRGHADLRSKSRTIADKSRHFADKARQQLSAALCAVKC